MAWSFFYKFLFPNLQSFPRIWGVSIISLCRFLTSQTVLTFTYKRRQSGLFFSNSLGKDNIKILTYLEKCEENTGTETHRNDQKHETLFHQMHTTLRQDFRLWVSWFYPTNPPHHMRIWSKKSTKQKCDTWSAVFFAQRPEDPEALGGRKGIVTTKTSNIMANDALELKMPIMEKAASGTCYDSSTESCHSPLLPPFLIFITTRQAEGRKDFAAPGEQPLKAFLSKRTPQGLIVWCLER